MQTPFPVYYSTLSPGALAAMMVDRYSFAAVECKLLVKGVGDTYTVSADGVAYILRVYRNPNRSVAHVEAEVDLLTQLHASGAGVSYPIADKDGGYIQLLNAPEGVRCGVLFSYAVGKPAAKLSDEQLRTLGRQMASYHEVSSTVRLRGERWTYDIETTITRPLDMIRPFFEDNPEDHEWLLSSAEVVKKAFAGVGSAEGYCHFDFLPKNFHFSDEGALTFFDFDFFGYGWLVYDVMTFWAHLMLDVHFGRMDQAEADRSYSIFVAAYREVRILRDDELALVPYLNFAWWVFYMGFYTTHDNFYALLQPAMLKLRMGLMRQLMQRYWPANSPLPEKQ